MAVSSSSESRTIAAGRKVSLSEEELGNKGDDLGGSLNQPLRAGGLLRRFDSALAVPSVALETA